MLLNYLTDSSMKQEFWRIVAPSLGESQKSLSGVSCTMCSVLIYETGTLKCSPGSAWESSAVPIQYVLQSVWSDFSIKDEFWRTLLLYLGKVWQSFLCVLLVQFVQQAVSSQCKSSFRLSGQLFHNESKLCKEVLQCPLFSLRQIVVARSRCVLLSWKVLRY